MYKAVCDECGQNCEVPFRPSGDKPIYCSNCFEGKGGGSSGRSGQKSSGRPHFEKRDNTNKQLLEQVSSLNTKLDRILRVIESSVEKKKVEKPQVVEKKEVVIEAKEEPKDEKKKIKKPSKKKVKKSASKD
jgi:CxxC-x17-CxxC domain-containing protein